MIDREDFDLIRNILDINNQHVDYDLLYKILTGIKDFPHLESDILDSFSNNQVKSKSRVLDLVSKHNFVNSDFEVIIIGSWYGSILIPRLANRVRRISCIDLDEQVLKIAKNRLFSEYKNIDYIAADVFEKDLSRYHTADLIINTSCEHMQPMKDWPYWDYFKPNSYFALQSNNMYDIEGHVNCVDSIAEFKAQLPDFFEVYSEEEIEDSRGIRFSLVGCIK